jgi:hypothetical protein
MVRGLLHLFHAQRASAQASTTRVPRPAGFQRRNKRFPIAPTITGSEPANLDARAATTTAAPAEKVGNHGNHHRGAGDHRHDAVLPIDGLPAQIVLEGTKTLLELVTGDAGSLCHGQLPL